MKLDTRALRYLTAEDWRVLAAVEQGSKNHELVPTPLISQIASLRDSNSVHRCISNLAKVGLIAKVKNARYDGYRLTYGGLDYLALNTHRRSDTITSLGNQIGVGKESDIFVCANAASQQLVLKLHRLGRISFRTVKANRDYLRNRSTGSWMYLSRLAAQKEHAFMKVLYREKFPVPRPVAWSRHSVVMQFIDAFPLRMISSVPDPGKLYAELMALIVQLAQHGLIHGDFNEFNILIIEKSVDTDEHTATTNIQQTSYSLTPIIIDFPQTLSTNHANAEFYFERDVNCIKRYFERRFKYVSDEPGPFFKDATMGIDPEKRLDVEVEATGFSKKMAKELEQYVEATTPHVDNDNDRDEDSEPDSIEEQHGAEDDANVAKQSSSDAIQNGTDALSIIGHGNNDQHGMTALEVAQDTPLSSLDPAQDLDVLAHKAKERKKSAGWAI